MVKMATSKSTASSLSLTESSAMQSKSKSMTFPSPSKSSAVQPDALIDKLSSLTPTTTFSGNQLVQCELLYFVNGVYGKHPESLIRTSVMDFYRDDEIFAAKQLLVRALVDVTGLDINPYSKNRIGNNKVKSSVDDIMHIFQLVDEGCFHDKIPTFCAVNKSRVPLLADEMSDLASIRLELSQLRQHVQELSSQLSTSCRCKNNCVDTVTVKSVANHVQSESTGVDILSKQLSDEVASGCMHHAVAASSVTDVGAAGDDSGGSSGSVPHLNLAAATESMHSISSGTSYANTLQADLDDFEEVNRKARRERKKNKSRQTSTKAVTGACSVDSNSVLPFAGVEKKSVICISRLEPDTTAEQLKEFLHSIDVSVLSCYAYSDKHDRYTFMRVCMPQSDEHKVFVASIWPRGVIVRPWVFKAGAKRAGVVDNTSS